MTNNWPAYQGDDGRRASVGDIAEDELLRAAITLKRLAVEYHPESDAWHTIIEAQRLVMSDLSIRYGDEAWERADRALSTRVAEKG